MLYSQHAGDIARSITLNAHSVKNQAAATDEYMTISDACRREIKVQGSMFIADIVPVGNEAAAEEALVATRREFHDATHHSYAYRIAATESRFSDDGEPAGTAGRPILAAIEHEGLVGTLIVVTRYFGGVKLGTGGLSRAYAEAARAAIGAAPRERRFLTDTLRITFPHETTGRVMHLLGQAGATVKQTSYDDRAHFIVEVRRSRTAELRLALAGQSGGKVRVEDGGDE